MFHAQSGRTKQYEYDEQHRLDLQAFLDAKRGLKNRKATSEEAWEMWSTLDTDIAPIREKHPTLGLQQLCEIWRYREGTTKDEQSTPARSIETEELRAKLKKNEDEKRATEERTNTFIKKLQQENSELKDELRQLKGEHEETLSKLEKSADVASRDAALERNLVLLAQGVLNLKVSTEKKFKKLGKQVKKSAGDQKEAELQEESAQKLEEKDDVIETLRNTVTCLEAHVKKHTEDEREFHKANLKLKWTLLQKESAYQRELDEAKFKHAREIQKLKEKLGEKNEQSSISLQRTKDEQFAKEHMDPKRLQRVYGLVLTEEQTDELEDYFINVNKYQSGIERKRLARKIGLTENQVKIWFQNRLRQMNDAEVKNEHSNN